MESWLLGTASRALLLRVRRGEFVFCMISFVHGWPGVLRLSQSQSCVSTSVQLSWGSVKGRELRGNCPSDRMSTVFFELCVVPYVELKL